MEEQPFTPAQPVHVVSLFPELHAGLIDVLAQLTQEQWQLPTVCADWSVHDVALHLLGADIGILSRKRDGYALPSAPIHNWQALVDFINRQNDLWVQATRRISPNVLRDLLHLTGPQVSAFFATLDPDAVGMAVSWAGPDPAPVWLDLAREYTERWHHQQHIRDAANLTGFTEPRFMTPALRTFAFALPHTYRDVAVADGTSVTLILSGKAGGAWTVLREGGRWRLYEGRPAQPNVIVTLPPEAAWRLFTKGLSPRQVQSLAHIEGNVSLASTLFNTVALIA
jgi:uncharacterized protein (TIGR03083 family)